jgi:rod shape-determining protein MreD
MDDRTPGIRPRQTIGRRLDALARRAFPLAMTVALVLVTAAPFRLPGQAELQNAAALACVWFWSVYRPLSMPPPAVFLVGLLADLLDFAPPGVGVVSLLVAHAVAVRFRRSLIRQGFLTVWLAFAGMATALAALQWVLTSLLTLRLVPPGPALFQAMLAAGLYPLLAVLLARAHRTIAEPANA